MTQQFEQVWDRDDRLNRAKDFSDDIAMGLSNAQGSTRAGEAAVGAGNRPSGNRVSENRAAIALGGNLGNSKQILSNAITVIDRVPGIRVCARSHFYQTAPVGPPQPDYINACITVETSLSPRDLLHRLLAVESQFGRVRKERWGARSLDLDLLLYGDHIIEAPRLSVPHPRLHERPFVLIPLMDVAAHWQHPILKETVEQLFSQLSEQGLMTGVERLVSYESQTV